MLSSIYEVKKPVFVKKLKSEKSAKKNSHFFENLSYSEILMIKILR